MRALPGARDEVLLIPLPGHTRGHCGVAVRSRQGWLLHCGDAYFHHAEVAAGGGAAPPGLRFYEALIERRRRGRLANQARLRDLARRATGEVRLVCSHDLSEFTALRGEERPA